MKAYSFTRLMLPCLVLLGCLSGCMTTRYQLQPVSGAVAWIDGRPTTRAEQNGVAVVASFERLDLEYIALDIEMKNLTDQPLEVDPARFQYTTLNQAQEPMGPVDNPDQPLRLAAADPALESDRVATAQNREVKRIKRAKVINTVLMVALVASDVASSSRHNQTADRWVQNRITHNNLYTALNAKRLIDHSAFADRIQRYDYEAYRWRELALHRTTVAPGESVRGLVYLPLRKDVPYLLVQYDLPESDPIGITFRQEWVKERTRRK